MLGEFETPEQLHRAEILAISDLGTLSPGGYNVSVGGDTAPSKNPEVAAKIAAAAKGRKHADTSSWSDALRKQWQDPAYRAKISAGARAAWTDEMRAAAGERSKARWEKRRAEGWAMPEEAKAKIRQRKFSDEALAKMRESAKKRGIPAEQRQKMVEAQRDRRRAPHSEDRCKNIAAGIKAAWADPVKRERLMAARKAAWETRRQKQLQTT